MLTSFGANVPVFWSECLLLFCKARLFTTQNPAFGAEKPGFPPFFLPVHRF